MFWAFRVMVGLGFLMLALFALAFWSTLKSQLPGTPLVVEVGLVHAARALDRL